MTCCTGNCSQGRECPNSPTPSRAALGMRTLGPLHQAEGGHIVRGPLSFPIEREEDDEPLITLEAADSAWSVVQSVLAFIVVAALALAAVALRSKGAM